MLELIIIAIGLGLDLWSKHWAQSALPPLPGGTMPLLQDVFHLTYVENRGAAFSILQGKRTFFLVISVLALLLVGGGLLLYRKKMGPWLRVALSLMIVGILGNGYDRLVFGYVRDLFDFRAINFPVFNIADSALVAAVIMVLIFVLFWDKDDGLKKNLLHKGDKGPPDSGGAAEKTEL